MDITIVICLYNAEKYIMETLASIESQTFSDFKLLIINDCSTDASLEIVEEYLLASEFKEYEIIDFKENRGTAYVRNQALTEVDTPLIIFFDADDIARPQLLEEYIETMNSDDNILAVSCYSSYM